MPWAWIPPPAEGNAGGSGPGSRRAGSEDALTGGKTLLTEEELKAVLAALRIELHTRQRQALKDLGEKNKRDAAAFLAENKTREGVVTLPSGLQYRVLQAGEGAKPTADDTVVCHYRGTLIDGKEFDSSLTRNRPATLPLKSVIKGWSEALQLMPVGSKWQLFIPPDLAYAERGAARGGIGPNATLIFDVELLSIKDKAQASQPPPESAARQDVARRSAAP
jgi:FKBP-type peptidyl-prolyl cis-trans isomerase